MAGGAGGSIAYQPGSGEGAIPVIQLEFLSTGHIEGLSSLIRKKPLLDDEPPLAGYSTTSRREIVEEKSEAVRRNGRRYARLPNSWICLSPREDLQCGVS